MHLPSGAGPPLASCIYIRQSTFARVITHTYAHLFSNYSLANIATYVRMCGVSDFSYKHIICSYTHNMFSIIIQISYVYSYCSYM